MRRLSHRHIFDLAFAAALVLGLLEGLRVVQVFAFGG